MKISSDLPLAARASLARVHENNPMKRATVEPKPVSDADLSKIGSLQREAKALRSAAEVTQAAADFLRLHALQREPLVYRMDGTIRPRLIP